MLSMFVYRQKRRKNKRLLGHLGEFPDGTMAVGRLDEKSEGLLFLTTDGKVSHAVRSKLVEKEYWVQVDGEINPEAIERLKRGVEISVSRQKYRTLPCKARILANEPTNLDPVVKIRADRHGPTSWISITLREGKFRQVRKMTASVGFPTLRLIRYRIGQQTLEGLIPGEIREVDCFNI